MSKDMRRLLSVGMWTFLLSGVVTLATNRLIGVVPFLPGFALLLFVIIFGVAFDILGVAATAAHEGPLHAAAVDRVPGSAQAVRLVRHADRVASFANDLVGDIAGTVSGAIAIALSLQLLLSRPGWDQALIGTGMVAFSAALTVAGKAWGKRLAVSRAESIILAAGRSVAAVEAVFGVVFLSGGKDNKRKRRNSNKRKPRK